MTAQARIRADQLRRVAGGSYRTHEDLVHAVLQLLALRGVPAVPIVTGPRVAPRKGGGFELRKNAAQRGFGDVAGALPPRGRLLMCECKTGGARRSPAQVRMHEHFSCAGALCLVVREIDEFARELDQALANETVSMTATGRFQ